MDDVGTLNSTYITGCRRPLCHGMSSGVVLQHETHFISKPDSIAFHMHKSLH
ncbi:hypothetical protein I79_001835 [Cricetulus griseus]|uniref:Uncharacterized protein n=1 Tax=Cricetulus griseus TaxID=10029 RepID=G3GVT6_CRIGR|nr:hypothetical protein I79_001835 [Cricetulus griseus]